MRALGLDYGSKRIGVALGDTASQVASPWCVLPHTSRGAALDRLAAIIQQEAIDVLVVGIPFSLGQRQKENGQMEEIRSFIVLLRERGWRVEEMDETLSSKMAAVFMKDRGERGKRDDLAAAVILQSWLDKV